MEQTKRGEADRQREKEVIEGEPAQNVKGDAAGQAGNTTRDKGVEPAADHKRGRSVARAT